MHPLANERLLTRQSFGLSDLVLVMRELQVGRAAVDIERHAEILRRHHGALDVPTGTTRPPRRRPRRFALFGRLPQREIERVLFPCMWLDALTGAHLIEGSPREFPVT